jgi:hypothetical protein
MKCQIYCHTLPEHSIGISGETDQNHFLHKNQPIPAKILTSIVACTTTNTKQVSCG